MKFIIRPLLYLLAFAAAYYYTYFEALRGEFAETYWTEVPQELILLVIVILHAVIAKRHSVGRSLNILLGGIALASLIREHNNQLADLFFHRAWVVGVIPVVIATAAYTFKHYREVIADFQLVRDTFGFGVLMTGFLTLHLFSRLFGANDLWRATMGDQYMRVVARTAEEGVELLAYFIILLGTVEVVLTLTTIAKRERGILKP